MSQTWIVYSNVNNTFTYRVEGTEFMITCLADSTCEFGMMKRKVLAVADYLQEPLKFVAQ